MTRFEVVLEIKGDGGGQSGAKRSVKVAISDAGKTKVDVPEAVRKLLAD